MGILEHKVTCIRREAEDLEQVLLSLLACWVQLWLKFDESAHQLRQGAGNEFKSQRVLPSLPPLFTKMELSSPSPPPKRDASKNPSLSLIETK